MKFSNLHNLDLKEPTLQSAFSPRVPISVKKTHKLKTPHLENLFTFCERQPKKSALTPSF